MRFVAGFDDGQLCRLGKGRSVMARLSFNSRLRKSLSEVTGQSGVDMRKLEELFKTNGFSICL